MINQRKQTSTTHVNFESFVALCVYFDPQNSKGKSSVKEPVFGSLIIIIIKEQIKVT